MKDLIVLHGALGSTEQMEPIKNALRNDFNVHGFSFSGHGGMAFNKQFNIPQFTDELKAFIESNELQGASIFGYSMGGYVALYLAKQHPNLVGRIMTLGTKFKWSPEIASKEVKMLNPEIIEAKIPKFAQDLKERHQPLDWKEVLRRTAEMMHGMGEHNPLLLDDYKHIENHVNIGLADQDEMVGLEETTEVFEALPNSSFYRLPDSNHPIERVNLEALTKELINFMS